jgi:hypothetical protein
MNRYVTGTWHGLLVVRADPTLTPGCLVNRQELRYRLGDGLPQLGVKTRLGVRSLGLRQQDVSISILGRPTWKGILGIPINGVFCTDSGLPEKVL